MFPPNAQPPDGVSDDSARCVEDTLTIRRCAACNKLFAPLTPACSACASEDLEWVPSSGAGSIVSWHNFGRSWRAARGENYSWVTPRTFRRGGGTAVDNAYGDPERAARQLGNNKAVAKAHYIDETAPDNREVLERWARGERPKT
ncbi:Zn-ribbon domain-containing OB-fold protein [Nocardia sp. NPDC059228]|uniref:Zn-ribbon domain-containing OB-fold protein n=1 Tax=Nocardia sp. NPDC059228 TaxID=3346777 RepID=UPI0036B6301E